MEEQGFRYVVEEVTAILHKYFYEKEIIWFILTILLCINLLRVIIGTLFKSRKKEWDSFYFKWLCLTVFVWTFSVLYPYITQYLPPEIAANKLLTANIIYLSNIAIVFFLPFLCLHIWKQVSYREIGSGTIALYFLPALVFTSLYVRDMIQGFTLNKNETWMETTIGRVAYYIFAVSLLVKTYLMMFNVFYQMPPHMRRATKHMLSGVTYVVAAEFIRTLLPDLPPYDFTLLGVHIMLDYLYNAFSIDSSANVIVTSRDFVFGNLSTMVIILSKRMNILDWNRKTDAHKLLLPTPQYKEPFRHYYQRILKEGNGRVSAHDRNIITTTRENSDGHYLITTHEVKRKKRHFGYLVEISEVTKIYTVFRYLEEIAIKDQLTGLYNRNAYMSMVSKMVAPENLPLLIVVGDMNNLKPINDIYGHLKGDELLTAASKFIKELSPEDSFVARIGGDEFVMLVPNGSLETATEFIESINEACSGGFDDTEFELSISWGYALLSDENQEYNTVFDQADAMMYASKRQRSRFHSSGIIPDSRKYETGELNTSELNNDDKSDDDFTITGNTADLHEAEITPIVQWKEQDDSYDEETAENAIDAAMPEIAWKNEARPIEQETAQQPQHTSTSEEEYQIETPQHIVEKVVDIPVQANNIQWQKEEIAQDTGESIEPLQMPTTDNVQQIQQPYSDTTIHQPVDEENSYNNLEVPDTMKQQQENEPPADGESEQDLLDLIGKILR